jgi:hypothetical protein
MTIEIQVSQKHCYGKEMPPALDRHQQGTARRVILIILRP